MENEVKMVAEGDQLPSLPSVVPVSESTGVEIRKTVIEGLDSLEDVKVKIENDGTATAQDPEQQVRTEADSKPKPVPVAEVPDLDTVLFTSSSTDQASAPLVPFTSSAASSCPTVLAALMSKPKSTPPHLTFATTLGTSTNTTSVIVTPGTKDSDGFLTPPPASTLLLRRTRVNSTGSSTYVIASNQGPSSSISTPSSSNSDVVQVDSKPGRSRSTSGRSIKRPKFDDERVTTEVSKRYTVIVTPAQVPNASSEKTVPVETQLSSDLLEPISQNQDGLGLIGISSLPTTPSLLKPGPSPASAGKGIVIKKKPKIVSKGKPASFTTDLAEEGMKKPRKERSPDKFRNVDPLTGKRRYIKKKSYRSDDRPKFGNARTVAASDLSLTADPPKPTWRPADDLRLIVNVKQTCDLKIVHAGIAFSCDFTLEHLQARWNEILYNKNVSKVCQMAIVNLHSKVKADIYARALYSKEEDELVKTVKSTEEKANALLLLEKLLDLNSLVFLKWRTVRDLWKHWKELKEFHLLCDQTVDDYFKHESFVDIEDGIRDKEIRNDVLDSAVYQELLLENKHMRKKIRLAEEELVPWKMMAELANDTEPRSPPSEDEELSFAMLRGVLQKYYMKSRSITIGRKSETNMVDMDLTQEGSMYKVSRRQGEIQLRTSGDFVFYNKGKHSIFLDGETLLPGRLGRLRDQSIIQISGLKFIFLVNQNRVYDLLVEIRQQKQQLKAEANQILGIFKTSPTLDPMEPRPYVQSTVPPPLGYPRQSYSTPPQSSLNTRPVPMHLPAYYNPSSQSSLYSVPSRTKTPIQLSTTPLGFPRPRAGLALLQNSQFLQLPPSYTSAKPGPLYLTSPMPTIFRRQSTSSSVASPPNSSTTPEVHSLQQPSVQFGDLTIRPGAPPPPQHLTFGPTP